MHNEDASDDLDCWGFQNIIQRVVYERNKLLVLPGSNESFESIHLKELIATLA